MNKFIVMLLSLFAQVLANQRVTPEKIMKIDVFDTGIEVHTEPSSMEDGIKGQIFIIPTDIRTTIDYDPFISEVNQGPYIYSGLVPETWYGIEFRSVFNKSSRNPVHYSHVEQRLIRTPANNQSRSEQERSSLLELFIEQKMNKLVANVEGETEAVDIFNMTVQINLGCSDHNRSETRLLTRNNPKTKIEFTLVSKEELVDTRSNESNMWAHIKPTTKECSLMCVNTWVKRKYIKTYYPQKEHCRTLQPDPNAQRNYDIDLQRMDKVIPGLTSVTIFVNQMAPLNMALKKWQVESKLTVVDLVINRSLDTYTMPYDTTEVTLGGLQPNRRYLIKFINKIEGLLDYQHEQSAIFETLALPTFAPLTLPTTSATTTSTSTTATTSTTTTTTPTTTTPTTTTTTTTPSFISVQPVQKDLPLDVLIMMVDLMDKHKVEMNVSNIRSDELTIRVQTQVVCKKGIDGSTNSYVLGVAHLNGENNQKVFNFDLEKVEDDLAVDQNCTTICWSYSIERDTLDRGFRGGIECFQVDQLKQKMKAAYDMRGKNKLLQASYFGMSSANFINLSIFNYVYLVLCLILKY